MKLQPKMNLYNNVVFINKNLKVILEFILFLGFYLEMNWLNVI
jgi:hypothetical protein